MLYFCLQPLCHGIALDVINLASILRPLDDVREKLARGMSAKCWQNSRASQFISEQWKNAAVSVGLSCRDCRV